MNPMHAWELEPVFGYPIRHPELYNKTKETEEMKNDRRKRQTTEATTTTTVKPDVNVTFEQLFSNISMTTVGNFSKYGKLDEPWLKFNDTNKLGLVISGNLSEVKYVNATTKKCMKLAALFKKYEDILPKGSHLDLILERVAVEGEEEE
uniref:DUF659 domain-containing protein n=1 Tax=Strongyloides papillosus TaxID=174720 RepID=A0A0N5CHF5_STREA